MLALSSDHFREWPIYSPTVPSVTVERVSVATVCGHLSCGCLGEGGHLLRSQHLRGPVHHLRVPSRAYGSPVAVAHR